MSEKEHPDGAVEPEPTADDAEETTARRPLNSIRGWLRDLGIAGLAVVLIGVFLVQPFRVDGQSMEPVLLDGERILVNKLAYRVGEVGRGDVVIVKSPSGQTLVKRVVGLPGETVAVEAGTVVVDGTALSETYLATEKRTGESLPGRVLREDEYFVLGDNRLVSHDSRVFGPIVRHDISGRAEFRYWPLGQAGSLDGSSAAH